MASPLNFDLKSSREQDAIEYAYQGFLNGLHFPIQIIVRSRKIDLENYLSKLESLQSQQENQLLAGLMEDYIFNIRGLLEDVNIMAKSFYVIVPYYIQSISKENIISKLTGLLKQSEDVVESSEDYEKHKRDILQRTNIVAQGLAQIGVRAAVLTTQELVELYYGSYNMDESSNQPLVDPEGLSTPSVERNGANPLPHGTEQRVAEPEDMFAAARKISAAHAPLSQQAQHAVVSPVSAPAQAAAAPVQQQPTAAPVAQPQTASTAAPINSTAPASQQAAQPGQAVQIPQPQTTTQQPNQGGPR